MKASPALVYFVQFANIPEDRESERFGPFEFVQLTYSELRFGHPHNIAGDIGDSLATIEHDGDHAGEWRISREFHKQNETEFYTDVFIEAAPVTVAKAVTK